MARRAMIERGTLRVTVVVALMGLTLQGEALGQAAPSPGADVDNPVADVPLATLKATRERPLFSRGRRPPSVPLAVAPSPQPIEAVVAVDKAEAPPFTLMGTVIGPRDRTAILMNESSKAATRLREGEQVSGWMLVSVGRRSAVLGNDGRTVTLELPNTKAGANFAVGELNGADAIAGGSIADVGVSQASGRRLSAAVKARQVDR